MCGIAGFYGRPNWSLTELRRMTVSLAHRGPDDAGYFLDRREGVGLGHRRLAVLDLSKAGHQPMTYEESDCWITYNGEVYNFIELREELEGRGFRFRSSTDTEVVLASYLAWGVEALSRFNGMWAFGIFDRRQRKLILCRDRYGVKPLYYHFDGERLAFASECKAFWAVGAELGLDWDERGLKTALIDPFQLESSGKSYFKHVHNLPPGHMLTITGGRGQISRWWNTLDHLHSVPNDFKEQCAVFKDLLDDACQIRMRSDVGVGTSLSGGLDSSSVVSSLSRRAGRGRKSGSSTQAARPTAFIHSFPDTFLDETSDAVQVAISAGVDYRLISAEAGDFAQHLDDILYSLEGVFGGMLDGPWRIYRAQRQCGMVVSLDGHGADELLGGYWWHPPFALRDAKLPSSRFWKTVMLEKDIYGENLPRNFLLSRIFGRSSALQKGARWLEHDLGLSFRPGPKVPSFFSEAAEEVLPYPGRRLETSNEFDHLGTALYDDFHNGVMPRILKNFDAMSMAHGVEVRAPFLDYRLVNFAFSLPSSSKIDRGYTKLILRDAMAGDLPDRVRLSRKKIGFTSPVADWFRGLMRPWMEDCLDDPACESDLVDKDRLRCAFEAGLRDDKFDWAEALEIWKYASTLKLQAIARLSHGREDISHLVEQERLDFGDCHAGPTAL